MALTASITLSMHPTACVSPSKTDQIQIMDPVFMTWNTSYLLTFNTRLYTSSLGHGRRVEIDSPSSFLVGRCLHRSPPQIMHDDPIHPTLCHCAPRVCSTGRPPELFIKASCVRVPCAQSVLLVVTRIVKLLMPHHRPSVVGEDANQLAALGHTPELERTHSFLSMLGLAFALLNSWTGLSASLSLALPSGGSAAVIWGLITAGICNLCLAASLAEFLSAYPTAGGQYHWVAVIARKRHVPILSWITGWISVSGWIMLVSSGGLLGSQLIVGVISLMHESYESQRWHQFLIYIAYTLVAFFINAFLNRLLPLVTRFAFMWLLLGLVVISVTVLACASPSYASGDYVFRAFLNDTGWPDGIAWLLGLLQASLGSVISHPHRRY